MRRRVLQIDAGNSAAKWRLVEDERILERGTSRLSVDDDPGGLEAAVTRAQEVWLASVLAPDAERQLDRVLSMGESAVVHRVRASAFCAGVRNSYTDPERMGVDRWLALLAARARYPDQRICVVDAGTALTIDLLSADGRHDGGYILPGPSLMVSALFAGTGRVRDAALEEWSDMPGTNTADAVGGGVVLGLAGAVMEALRRDRARTEEQSEEPGLLLTGGYADRLLAVTGLSGTLVPDLVFEGLEVAVRETGV